MDEKECYKKLYGDLFYCVKHYHQKATLTAWQVYQGLMMVNVYPKQSLLTQ